MNLCLISFNPCYNGKGIIAEVISDLDTGVLSFNPCYNGKGIIASIIAALARVEKNVSILVIMERG